MNLIIFYYITFGRHQEPFPTARRRAIAIVWPVVRYDNPPVRYNLLGHVAAMLENTRILDSAFAWDTRRRVTRHTEKIKRSDFAVCEVFWGGRGFSIARLHNKGMRQGVRM